jgi:hypothetical protein
MIKKVEILRFENAKSGRPWSVAWDLRKLPHKIHSGRNADLVLRTARPDQRDDSKSGLRLEATKT